MPQLCVAICWRSATVPAKGNGREPPGQSLEATEQKELLLTTQLPHGHEQPLHPPHIPTLAVGALLRAFASSLLALSYSLFSDSSLTAASQISSLLGLACENTKWQTNASSESTADLIPRLIQIKIEVRDLSIHIRTFSSLQAPPKLLWPLKFTEILWSRCATQRYISVEMLDASQLLKSVNAWSPELAVQLLQKSESLSQWDPRFIVPEQNAEAQIPSRGLWKALLQDKSFQSQSYQGIFRIFTKTTKIKFRK